MLRQRESARKALRNSHLTRAKFIKLSSQSTLATLTRIVASVTPSWAPPHTWRLTRHIAKRAALPSHPPSRLRLFDAAPSVCEKQPQWVNSFPDSPPQARPIARSRLGTLAWFSRSGCRSQSLCSFKWFHTAFKWRGNRRAESGERRVESGKRRGENVTVVASWDRARRARAFLALSP